MDGRQLDVTQAAVRWLGYGQWFVVFGFLSALSSIVGLISLAWPFLLLITTIISPTKQGLHDRIAGTWLVRPAAADSSGLALGCILLLGLLVIIPIGDHRPDLPGRPGQHDPVGGRRLRLARLHSGS